MNKENMPIEIEEKNLRKSASATLETLHKAHEIMRALNGEYPAEKDETRSDNGSLDELSNLLADINHSAGKLTDLLSQINQRV